MISTSRIAKFASVTLLAAMSLPSLAATTWGRTDGTCAAVGDGSNMGNSCAATKDSVTATVRAYANSEADGTWATAALTAYGGGFGVNNGKSASSDPGEGGNPEHAIDGQGHTDAVLFQFSSSTSLSALTIGWSSGDADISVMAWTGSGSPINAGNSGGALFDKTTGNMIAPATGWTLIGNFGDVNDINTGSSTDQLNFTTNVTSSWWLVSAYNSNYAGSCTKSKSDSGCGAGNDYFKLLSVTGTATPPGNDTPEPATLALAGLAVFGAGVARRRTKKA